MATKRKKSKIESLAVGFGRFELARVTDPDGGVKVRITFVLEEAKECDLTNRFNIIQERYEDAP